MAPVALITGSGRRRVGWHVARALAMRGFCLAIHYHRSVDEAQQAVEEFRAMGIEAMAFGADLTSETQVATMVEQVRGRFGRINALVNCAAIWHSKRLEETTAADVRAHFEANVLGTFLCSQHAGLAMCDQAEGGNIVMIGDWAEARPYPDYPAYFASKGSIPTLTRMLAVELALRNPRVRVNCILPGPVMLPPDLPPAERAESIAGTLLGREGSPDNIALAVLHFIDNDFVTGACLPVDGGRSIQSS